MKRYNEELLNALREYIIDYQMENGSSPTYRKIMQNFPNGFTSTSKLSGYINVLCERRLIERDGNGSIKVDKPVSVIIDMDDLLISSKPLPSQDRLLKQNA